MRASLAKAGGFPSLKVAEGRADCSARPCELLNDAKSEQETG
jgi:hypothetical protein